MEKRPKNRDVPFIPNHQSAEVGEPGEGSFDRPAPAVAPQRSAVLGRRASPSLPMRADQLDSSMGQPNAMGVGIVGAVGDQSLGLRCFSPSITRRDDGVIEGGLQQGHLRRRGRCQPDAQRNSLAVCHHHALCSLATFRLSDACAPFFAGKKLASTNASSQSSHPASSRSERKVLHTSTHTPCSSQSRSRRQHVLGDGYLSGRSCHRAPVRRIQRMPSSTRRLSIGRRPPFEDGSCFGSSGSISAHWSSVSNGFAFLAIVATPFARDDRRYRKSFHRANLRAAEF